MRNRNLASRSEERSPNRSVSLAPAEKLVVVWRRLAGEDDVALGQVLFSPPLVEPQAEMERHKSGLISTRRDSCEAGDR